MPGRALRIEDLKLPHRRFRRSMSRVRREWCFVRAVARQIRVRLVIMMAVLLGGGLLFRALEPGKKHSLVKAIYFTWSLVFAQSPESFPESRVLQAMFFLVPILGLTVIIGGIVDFALLLSDRRRSERNWCIMMASSMSDHIILVGLGRLGFRTYSMLHRLGEAMVVIERDEKSQFLDEVRRNGTPLIIGDARREALLEEANVTSARSVLLTTNDDLANLEIALDARRIVPHIRVVVRMFDQNMADKIRDGFNIHIAMSQSALAAPAFAMAALDRTIVNSFVVGDQLIVMQHWLVQDGGPLCGKTVNDVIAHYSAGVVEHRSREGASTLFPPPATVLASGDQLLVQGPFEKLFQAAPAG